MTRLILLTPLLLAACADSPFSLRGSPTETAAPAGTGPLAAVRPQGRPGDDPKEVATPSAPATGTLGTTIASLGNAAEPGVWLRTPLVRVRAPGQVSYQGQSVEAELIPIPGEPGSGSRASLQLMQALGAPLTGLPEVAVSR
ncbi:hypothetical protein OB2597_00130 [Pseudooceanicola batsensis HTCC2597]|uniref:D-galactarate dehydratase n=1 Tax=Pseudooceanicola batsensis (strain ATCC BAA-863 / DSM 15984 / KCTC 12145 / HTCC2597) TaxID=252305 RepID=A3U1J6_PSEBH|nr:hypothetical protein [Pseudooceanicola batsensis]EAQ01777.1 hypothetical protein OB2597_00130 [Pseudooceanicola batsensis HTCC2597]